MTLPSNQLHVTALQVHDQPTATFTHATIWQWWYDNSWIKTSAYLFAYKESILIHQAKMLSPLCIYSVYLVSVGGACGKRMRMPLPCEFLPSFSLSSQSETKGCATIGYAHLSDDYYLKKLSRGSRAGWCDAVFKREATNGSTLQSVCSIHSYHSFVNMNMEKMIPIMKVHCCRWVGYTLAQEIKWWHRIPGANVTAAISPFHFNS